MSHRLRHGFALAMTLWAITVFSIVGAAVVLSGRDSFDSARNRYLLERARWRGEGCMGLTRASIDSMLMDAKSLSRRARIWRQLRREIPNASFGGMPCNRSLLAAGDLLDVNTATPEELLRILAPIAGDEGAIVLVDALEDWRDADDSARVGGTESEWYLAAHRQLPRNAPLASVAELRNIRGFESLEGLDSLLTVESGRISLPTASIAVLAAAPGLSAQALHRINEFRNDGNEIDNLLTLVSIVSPSDADSIMMRFADLTHLTTVDPEAWIITVRASEGFPAVTATSEIRVIRQGNRAVVARRRTRT